MTNNALQFIGPVKTPTKAIAKEIIAHLNKIGRPLPIYPEKASSVIWGYNPDNGEHETGRALDIMVSNNVVIGNAVVDYLWKNRERFGLVHMIYRQRIKSTRVDYGRWRGMADRGNSTNNHFDHIHVLFSGKTIRPATGDGYAHPVLKLGSKGESVRHAQTLLHSRTAAVDGDYGPKTVNAVKYRQRASKIVADGVVGPKTWAVLHAYDKSKIK